MSVCPQCNTDHGSRCDACPHSGKVRGEWLDSPCRACDHEAILPHDRASETHYERTVHAQTAEQDRQAGAAFCRVFLEMDATTRDVAMWLILYPRATARRIAAETHMHRNTVALCVKRIREQHPQVWAAIEPIRRKQMQTMAKVLPSKGQAPCGIHLGTKMRRIHGESSHP